MSALASPDIQAPLREVFEVQEGAPLPNIVTEMEPERLKGFVKEYYNNCKGRTNKCTCKVCAWKEVQRRFISEGYGAEQFTYLYTNYGTYEPVVGLRQSIDVNHPQSQWQLAFIPILFNEQYISITKSRRIGGSELMCAFAFYTVGLSDHGIGLKCNYVSKSEPDSVACVKRIKDFMDFLPAFLRPAYGTGSKDSGGEKGKDRAGLFDFASRRASIAAKTATNAVRGLQSGLLIYDEFAHYEFPEVAWTAGYLTTFGGGKIIVVTTGNGGHTRQGKLHSEVFKGAKTLTTIEIVNGKMEVVRKSYGTENDFHAVFIPCSVLPNWEQERQRYIKTSTSIRAKAEQEMCRTLQEAFAGDVAGSAFVPGLLGLAYRLGEELSLRRKELEDYYPEVIIGGDNGDNSAHVVIRAITKEKTLYVCAGAQNQDLSFGRAAELGLLEGEQNGTVLCAYIDSAPKPAMKDWQDARSRLIKAGKLKNHHAIKRVVFSDQKFKLVEFLRECLENLEKDIDDMQPGEWKIAFDPSCVDLRAQLPAMKKKDGGRIDKSPGDNDHSVDSLIAGLFPYRNAAKREERAAR